jgi:hypothetical protein
VPCTHAGTTCMPGETGCTCTFIVQ